MNRSIKLLLLTFLTIGGTMHPSAGLRAEERHAFFPGELWPDNKEVHINAHGGGILFHDNTYYWYGEHKIEGAGGNWAHVGVHVYSSKDLYNWKDDGIALNVSSDPGSEIAKGCIIERPKVIYNRKTGKFVMWFHLELRGKGYSEARAGVAVAETPCGPFRFLESSRLNAGYWPVNLDEDGKSPLSPQEIADFKAKKAAGGLPGETMKYLALRRDFSGGQMSRDMTLFVDDDGSAYQITSSEDNATIHISQLSDDYLKPNGRYIRVFPGAYNEAPALFKHGGKYFLITSGCSSWNPNAARMAVADSIWGPWTSLGSPCVGTKEQMDKTFESQSTYVLPVAGVPGAFIFMADRWRPQNAIDGRYVWLPILWRDGKPALEWKDQWDLSVFKK